MKCFIFGAGYSGKAFAAAASEVAEITGTTRSAANFPALRAARIRPLLFDGTSLGGEIGEALENATHLVVSIAPHETGDPVVNAVTNRMRILSNLRWIGYLSTVGVYGDHQGNWVDEESACHPVSQRSVVRLAAERQWQSLAAGIDCPLAILRLSGIYGPGRNAFVNLANGTARRLVKPGQVFNRIHRDDIAAALWHLAGRMENGIFNVTDDRPAAPQDVVAHAASLMGIEPPPETDFAAADLSPMARSFYGENKRVSNARLKASGYRLRFSDYRAAHDHMWREGDWAGAGRNDARSPMRSG